MRLPLEEFGRAEEAAVVGREEADGEKGAPVRVAASSAGITIGLVAAACWATGADVAVGPNVVVPDGGP